LRDGFLYFGPGEEDELSMEAIEDFWTSV